GGGRIWAKSKRTASRRGPTKPFPKTRGGPPAGRPPGVSCSHTPHQPRVSRPPQQPLNAQPSRTQKPPARIPAPRKSQKTFAGTSMRRATAKEQGAIARNAPKTLKLPSLAFHTF